jgi:hypothetical protein
MITVTVGLVFFLIGMEFLFFTNRLQCDADNACKENKSWYRPFSEWIKDPHHIIPLKIIGALCLIISVYFLYLVE